MAVAAEAIDYVRSGRPAFLLIRTYRLNAHSKGDDDRDAAELCGNLTRRQTVGPKLFQCLNPFVSPAHGLFSPEECLCGRRRTR